MSESSLVVYWDASAAISLLFNDIHSETALIWWKKGTVHILSSLAYVEVAAVIARLERTGILDSSSTETALAKFTGLGWRKTKILPDDTIIAPYLACACTLHSQLPELRLLTFDSRLHDAAVGEGLVATL